MAERDLVVRFIGDDRSLNQAFTRQERRAKQFDTRTATVGAGLTRAFGAAGITVGVAAFGIATAKGVKAASDLNEQVSKTRQVFGQSSQAVEAWAKTTGDSFGVSERAALAAASTFGNLFRVIDLTPEKSAEMSRSLVQLAADLASFNNSSPEEALIALRSGLIGEAEPLRRFGVLLSEARVQQVALAQTGKQNVKTLSDQEKALARYSIILEDTASAQGDFERTSDSLANQTRTLKANLDELSANLGKTFLPAANAAVGGLNRLFSGFDALADFADKPVKIDIDTDIDISKLRQFRTELAAAVGEGDVRVRVLDATLQAFEGRLAEVAAELASQLSPALRKTSLDADGYATALADAHDRSKELVVVSKFLGSAMADAGSRMQAAAEDAKNLADATARAAAAAEKRFTTSIKGLQLKLEKAELTPGLEDDLAVLNEILARINRRIRAEGRTFELEQERVRVLQQIASLQGRIASDEASAAADAESAAKRRAQTARDEEARQRRAAATARDKRLKGIAGDQFAALGLTRTGEERVPGARALRKRAATLQDQIKGTALDTQKTRNQLRRIARVLSGEFGKVGKDVREAILGMIKDITDALKSGPDKVNEHLTPGRIRDPKHLFQGLDLSEEQRAQLRRRIIAAGGPGDKPQRGSRLPTGLSTGPDDRDVTIKLHINLDGREIATSTTKHQQKRGRRNPSSRRGAGAGRQHGG